MPQGVGELALTVLVILVILAVLAIWVFLRDDIANWVTNHFGELKNDDYSYNGPASPTSIVVPSEYFLIK